MNADTRALRGPSTTPPTATTLVPVLIQVPRLVPRSERRRPTRRRRRLRREIRVAAIALTCAAPMTWALIATGAGRPEASERLGYAAVDRGPFRTAYSIAADEPPVVTISLEPIRDLPPPVVLDGIAPAIAEEVGHGGG